MYRTDAGYYKKLFWIAVGASAAGLLLSETVKSSAAAVLIPFGIAYAAARLVRPAGVFLSHRAHVNPKVGCTVWAVLICFAAGCAVTSLSGIAWDKLSEASEYLPHAAEAAADMVSQLAGRIRRIIPDIGSQNSPYTGSGAEAVVTEAIRQAASQLGSSAAELVKKAVSVFPHGIFSVFIGVVAFVYLTADMDGIGKSLSELMGRFVGKEKAARISRSFSGFTDAVFTYLKSYLLLTLLTFAELSAGFIVVGLERPFAAAFAAAVVDALPLLGCGVIIVPWAVWCFVEGNIRRGVTLVVIQIIIYTVRQFAEPKIIGKMTGVHPFVVLAFLFAGFKIGGVAGMILAPIMLIAAVGMKKVPD